MPSAQTLTRKQLLERYVQASWVLKLRLISSRRHLWAETTSLIHVETALLQMRKACETIGYMCVIASEVELDQALPKHRKNYKVGDIFNRLKAANQLRFPNRARRSLEPQLDETSHWKLEIFEAIEEDHLRVALIHKRSGDLLHEKSPYLEWPQDADASQMILSQMLNGVRADHQWLWNRFWEHSISFGDGLFIVELGHGTNCSRPMVIKQDTLVEEDLNLTFDPEFVADFSGELQWPLDHA